MNFAPVNVQNNSISAPQQQSQTKSSNQGGSGGDMKIFVKTLTGKTI